MRRLARRGVVVAVAWAGLALQGALAAPPPAASSLVAGTVLHATRSVEDVHATLAQAKADMWFAYHDAQRQNPRAKGDVAITLTIAPSGRVSASHVARGGSLSADFENRVQAILQELDFGAQSVDAMDVNYTLSFAPG